jgi:glycerophosphoryl diester phosphodiesterase
MKILELLHRNGIISAHRGARALRPENTLSALRASVAHCDFMEIDVQLSRDKVPIIMHDDTLLRTTNVGEIKAFQSRVPYKVCDFTYEELLTLDYGSWFYKEGPFHPITQAKANLQKREPEPLLTLASTLQFVKENNLFINVEIKDVHEDFSDEEILSIVAKEIEAWHVEAHVVISSFRHAYLTLSKAKMPSVATAALVAKKHPCDNIKELIEYLKALKVDGYHLNDGLVDEEIVQILHKEGFFVNVYTVNDPLRQKELFEMGVNGVFSDFCGCST